MKAFPSFSLKPILNEILESVRRVNMVPVLVESKRYLSPIEIRRYIRDLRKCRQNSTW